jgi:hypothetical protein
LAISAEVANAHHLTSCLMLTREAPSAADLRAQLGRIRPRIHLYVPAAAVGMHPVRLSAFLNERTPLPADVAIRIQRAIAAGTRSG